MTTKETAGSRLSNLLQHLPEWSNTLGDIQIRILTECLADLYRQIVDGLRLDESLMSHVKPMIVESELPPLALLQIARLVMVCEDAPPAFIEDHAAEGLFESLIRQFEQLRCMIELQLGDSAWQFYLHLNELEARSRSMNSPQLIETIRLVVATYLEMVDYLMLDEARFTNIPVPAGWFEMVTGETRKMAAALVLICLEPDGYLNKRLPPSMRDEWLEAEVKRLTDFLVLVGAIPE